MSSNCVEYLHVRLREELERLGLSQADAARAIGDDSSQGIRDVLSGRKRASAELVGRLSGAGVDALYVLTGQRAAVSGYQASNAVAEHIAAGRQTAVGAYAEVGASDGSRGDGALTAEERALLDNFRACSPEGRTAIKTTSAALAQSTGLKKKTG